MFKNILKTILYTFIRLIEKVQYYKSDLDEDDITKKIIKSIEVNDLEIETDSGFEKVSNLYITQPYTYYLVETQSGKKLECADNHILFDYNFEEIFAGDLKIGDLIQTEDGVEYIVRVKKLNRKTTMIDCTVDSVNHRYYTNGILSHNTITSAIYILHYMLFNNQKNVLIAANVGDTATEILEKAKAIYQSLPFFLQKGVVVWNQKTIKFDNGSRAKAFTMTKTSSIGQAADLVYLDEFAYIPDTIADAFYKSIQPTLVSIENSKMIITSTPNGMNLFHKLFIDSERPNNDPLKNNFASMRVYWHQVPGRNVSYLRLNQFKLAQNNIDFDDVYNYVKELYDKYDESDENGVKYVSKVIDEETNTYEVHILNREGVTFEDVKALKVTNKDGESLPVGALGEISSWKEDAIKNIGGLEAFNQEFDLRFINASKSLFNESVLKNIEKGIKDFSFNNHEVFEKLKWDYSNVKFIEDESIFNIQTRKDLRIIISVDVSEGLGQDYSVINIFKIDKKDNELIDEQIKYYQSFMDFFCLKQIGLYRSNVVSVSKLAEMLYILAFEYFNDENVKIVLELNNHGHAVLEAIKNVFNRDNNYGSFIFFKFKHTSGSDKKKIGLKVHGNKKLLVKQYQQRIENKDIVIYDKDTYREMTTFIKNEKTSGAITYEADGSSKDDIVMTIVNMTEIFRDNYFRNMVEDYWLSLNDNILNEKINKVMGNNENVEGIDYDTFFRGKNRDVWR